MASGKEIRTKIKSVQNTQKITRAMEMVAASKMRKAQERMRAARPYGEKIRNVAAHLSHAHPEYKHPFLITRNDVRRVGVIMVTSDKGLCGGLNTNVIRMVLGQMKAWEAAGKQVDACALGGKGFGFLQRMGGNVLSHVTGLAPKRPAGRPCGYGSSPPASASSAPKPRPAPRPPRPPRSPASWRKAGPGGSPWAARRSPP